MQTAFVYPLPVPLSFLVDLKARKKLFLKEIEPFAVLFYK